MRLREGLKYLQKLLAPVGHERVPDAGNLALHTDPIGLYPEEKAAFLDDPDALARLHLAVWSAPEAIALELYLMVRARGMPIETPGVRP